MNCVKRKLKQLQGCGACTGSSLQVHPPKGTWEWGICAKTTSTRLTLNSGQADSASTP